MVNKLMKKTKIPKTQGQILLLLCNTNLYSKQRIQSHEGLIGMESRID